MSNRRQIKVVIAGITGRMGQASLKAIVGNEDFKLVGACARANAWYVGEDAGLTLASEKCQTGVLIGNDLASILSFITADVLLDFTASAMAFENAAIALKKGVHCVIGTSGLEGKQVEELRKVSTASQIGCLIVPNFSLGAVLMMEFAKQAAGIFDAVEIVEIHSEKKIDAPSGTAMHTLEKIARLNRRFNVRRADEKELIPQARGGRTASGAGVHSLRLPGVLSHQEVFFGSAGEMLTIRHDSFNTECFIKGIFLALQSVLKLKDLRIGLEEILKLEDIH